MLKLYFFNVHESHLIYKIVMYLYKYIVITFISIFNMRNLVRESIFRMNLKGNCEIFLCDEELISDEELKESDR